MSRKKYSSLPQKLKKLISGKKTSGETISLTEGEKSTVFLPENNKAPVYNDSFYDVEFGDVENRARSTASDTIKEDMRQLEERIVEDTRQLQERKERLIFCRNQINRIINKDTVEKFNDSYPVELRSHAENLLTKIAGGTATIPDEKAIIDYLKDNKEEINRHFSELVKEQEEASRLQQVTDEKEKQAVINKRKENVGSLIKSMVIEYQKDNDLTEQFADEYLSIVKKEIRGWLSGPLSNQEIAKDIFQATSETRKECHKANVVTNASGRPIATAAKLAMKEGRILVSTDQENTKKNKRPIGPEAGS